MSDEEKRESKKFTDTIEMKDSFTIKERVEEKIEEVKSVDWDREIIKDGEEVETPMSIMQKTSNPLSKTFKTTNDFYDLYDSYETVNENGEAILRKLYDSNIDPELGIPKLTKENFENYGRLVNEMVARGVESHVMETEQKEVHINAEDKSVKKAIESAIDANSSLIVEEKYNMAKDDIIYHTNIAKDYEGDDDIETVIKNKLNNWEINENILSAIGAHSTFKDQVIDSQALEHSYEKNFALDKIVGVIYEVIACTRSGLNYVFHDKDKVYDVIHNNIRKNGLIRTLLDCIDGSKLSVDNLLFDYYENNHNAGLYSRVCSKHQSFRMLNGSKNVNELAESLFNLINIETANSILVKNNTLDYQLKMVKKLFEKMSDEDRVAHIEKLKEYRFYKQYQELTEAIPGDEVNYEKAKAFIASKTEVEIAELEDGLKTKLIEANDIIENGRFLNTAEALNTKKEKLAKDLIEDLKKNGKMGFSKKYINQAIRFYNETVKDLYDGKNKKANIFKNLKGEEKTLPTYLPNTSIDRVYESLQTLLEIIEVRVHSLFAMDTANDFSNVMFMCDDVIYNNETDEFDFPSEKIFKETIMYKSKISFFMFMCRLNASYDYLELLDKNEYALEEEELRIRENIIACSNILAEMMLYNSVSLKHITIFNDIKEFYKARTDSDLLVGEVIFDDLFGAYYGELSYLLLADYNTDFDKDKLDEEFIAKYEDVKKVYNKILKEEYSDKVIAYSNVRENDIYATVDSISEATEYAGDNNKHSDLVKQAVDLINEVDISTPIFGNPKFDDVDFEYTQEHLDKINKIDDIKLELNDLFLKSIYATYQIALTSCSEAEYLAHPNYCGENSPYDCIMRNSISRQNIICKILFAQESSKTSYVKLIETINNLYSQ